MVSFRGLAWRSTTPVNRLERSDLSQTTPSSPAEIEVPSVQDLVGQLEAKEEQSRRRSSVGDRPSTPNFRAHPFQPLVPYSRTPSPSAHSNITRLPGKPSPIQEEVGRGLKAQSTSSTSEHTIVPLVFTTTDGGSIYHPYSLLPTPPIGGDDIGLDLNPHLPPSPLSQEVKTTAIDSETLPPLLDSPYNFTQSPQIGARSLQIRTEELSPLASPLASTRPLTPLSPLSLAVDSAADSSTGTKSALPSAENLSGTPPTIYLLDPSSTMTFNTSVRDLIQEAPDSPIGGKPAAPMDRERNVGTPAVRGKDFLESPNARVKSPAHNDKMPLKSRSNYSESTPGPSRTDESTPLPAPSTPQSEKSLAMVTAPDNPMFGRRGEFSDMSDLSFDGGPGGGTEVRDFMPVTKATEIDEDECPDCDFPTPMNDDGVIPYGLSMPPSEAEIPGSSAPLSPAPEAPSYATLPTGILTSNQLASVSPAIPAACCGPSGALMLMAPSLAPGIPITCAPSLPGVSGLSGVPAIPEGGENLYVPGSHLSRGLAVPADITGKLDPPKTPIPSKKRMVYSKGKRKGQKVVRRGRHLILRKPVLALVIGRQLAGPTSTALKLVSKGTPVDDATLTDASVPEGVPQAPVPLPA